MMAAGRAGELGKQVLLLEKMDSTGKKLLLCARGRCNVTNTAPLHAFMQVYGRGGGFLRTALETFDNERLRAFLLSYGVETVVENKGRVFPQSQRADSILHALEAYLRDGHVTVHKNSRVSRLILEAGRVTGVETQKGVFLGKNTLIATGGISYPATGSTGDGYALAASAGHTIKSPQPAIIAFETEEAWVKALQGTPIKNATIIAYQRNKKIAEHFGEALFTHYGISGPAILDISKTIVECLSSGPVQLHIDFKPNHALEKLDETLQHQIRKFGSKTIKSCLTLFISEKVAHVFLGICNIDPQKKASQMTVQERKKIVKHLKDVHLTIVRHRPIEESIITAGGVCLDEVDAKTLESKLVKGLYFAGETLDIDGPTGGFNLQAAFSTGYLAGSAILLTDDRP